MPVPSTVFDISTSAASNSPAGADAIGTSLDEYLRSIQAAFKQAISAGADIASSSSITPPASGSYFAVTGTTGITAIASTNSWNGRVITLRFAGALTLTHNASTLILPNGANYTTAAGDVFSFVQESSGSWRCCGYTLVSGRAIVGASGSITSSGLTMNTARLLGRTTASSGAIEEISIDSSLSLTGGVLSSAALPSQTGNAGKVLKTNGTTTSWDGAPTAGTAVATTSGTAIDFTSIPSWVKRITVMFNGNSTNGSNFKLVQIGAGSVTTSGYVSGSSIIAGASSATSTSTAGFIIRANSAADVIYGHLILTNVSGNIWVSSHNLYSDETTDYTISGGGQIALGGVLDRLRFTTVGGTDTFDAGSINILYE